MDFIHSSNIDVDLCDALIAQDNTKIEALEMKGDICKHFCQID